MAHLNFTVTHQLLELAPDCDFIVVENSRNYLTAGFVFKTDDWNGKTATAIFTRKDRGLVYHAALSASNRTCTVPWEALAEPGELYVSLYGGSRITTTEVRIKVHASGYTPDSEASLEPSQTVYEQLTSYFDVKAAEAAADADRAETAANSFDYIDGGAF